MIDAARPLPFRPQGRGLAPGLEALEAPQGLLIAYSSGPGTVAPDGPGPYGAYATAIAEMLRAPGVDLNTAFTHIRSRTHLSTQGQQTPWHVSNLGELIELVPPDAATAALPPPPPPRVARPMRALGADEAYALAIETDQLDRYVEFVDAYPDSPYSERVWAMIRARREALVWMRALQINTPQAYWTYRQRYPRGIYVYDAERRLRRLSAPLAPPAGFAMLGLAGLPLALRNEPREYRPIHRVGPPPPRLLMRPPPAYLVSLPPPAQRQGRGALPALQAPIPAVPRLAPAPRQGPPQGTVTAPSTLLHRKAVRPCPVGRLDCPPLHRRRPPRRRGRLRRRASRRRWRRLRRRQPRANRPARRRGAKVRLRAGRRVCRLRHRRRPRARRRRRRRRRQEARVRLRAGRRVCRLRHRRQPRARRRRRRAVDRPRPQASHRARRPELRRRQRAGRPVRRRQPSLRVRHRVRRRLRAGRRRLRLQSQAGRQVRRQVRRREPSHRGHRLGRRRLRAGHRLRLRLQADRRLRRRARRL